MSWWSKLADLVRRDRKARRLGEADAPADLGTARTRATGGVPNDDSEDRHSTTGTTPSATFVGRASGDEAGGGEVTGAERRADHHRSGAEGRSSRVHDRPGDGSASGGTA